MQTQTRYIDDIHFWLKQTFLDLAYANMHGALPKLTQLSFLCTAYTYVTIKDKC